MMNIRTYLLSIAALTATLLSASCNRAPQPAVMIVFHGGNEYHIVDEGDTYLDAQPAYFVRYYSSNPGNESVLEAERADLYAIIAKHINTNEHQRALIIATEETGSLFGLLKPREVSHSLTTEKVMTYLPKGAENVPE
jgi:hypothetical protein